MELILKIYRLELLIKVKIDLLNFILGVYIILKYKNGIQYLIVYYSRKLILAGLNCNIYNKKLLAVVVILKKQSMFLQGIIKLFTTKINYKNLIEFLTIKELN